MISTQKKTDALRQTAEDARDDIRAAAGRVAQASDAAMLTFTLVSAAAIIALAFATVAYVRTRK